MTIVRELNKTQRVNSIHDVFDTETGDYSKQMQGGTLLTVQPTDHVQYDFADYAYLNIESLRYVYDLVAKKSLRMVDVSYLMLLIQEMGKDGVLFLDQRTPHNQQTICSKYSIDSRTLGRSFKRLIQNNLITRENLSFLRLRKEAYVINPHLIKKGKKTHWEVSVLFDNLTEY